MRCSITLSAILLFSLNLVAQTIGFNRLYTDAANCIPIGFEILDEEYHVYCDCNDVEYILITNLQGIQQSFEPNAFNDCEVIGNGNPTTVSYFDVDKNEKLYLSQAGTNAVQLTRFFGNDCNDVIEQNYTYSFDPAQQITATDLAAKRGSQGGIFISAYEYLGETVGGFPGPHTFRLWIIKTDFDGNEIFRYQSPFDIYSLGTNPTMWIERLSYEGGAMVQFEQLESCYPHFATVDVNGENLYGGIIRENISYPITEAQLFSLDGGQLYFDFESLGGHTHRTIKKIKPADNLGVLTVGYYGLDGNGTFTVTQAGATITAAKGYYDGMNVVRHYNNSDYSFTKNYSDLPIPTLLKEAENGEALLVKSFGDEGLWILKTCFPDSEPATESIDLRINAYIPDPIIPMAGGGIGTLYHPGYSPGEVVIYDTELQTSWHLSTDDLLDSNDLLLETQDFDYVLPHHDSAYHFFNGMVLPNDLPTGDFYLIVHNDHTEKWIEENEENNYIAIPFKIYEESDITVTSTFTHEICQGEMYNDIILTESQTFIDTITLTNPDEYFTYDSIVINEVTVLQNSYTKVDAVLEAGSEYDGVVINSDTIITEIFAAANGCDSVVTTSIQTVTGLKHSAENHWNISAYPNPTAGTFLLTFSLPENRALNFYRMNVQGQTFNLPMPTTEFSSGQHQLTLDWSGIESGVHFLGVKSEGNMYWTKVVLIY